MILIVEILSYGSYCVAKRHVSPNEERNTDTPKKPVDAIKVEFSICSQLAHMKDGSIGEK